MVASNGPIDAHTRIWALGHLASSMCAQNPEPPLPAKKKKKKFKTCSMNGSDFAAATERKKKEKGSNLSNCSSPRKKKVLRLRILVVSELCWVYKRLVVRDVRNFL